MGKELNSYELSRAWFDFCFEHPDEIKPNHTALYFFAIEHCNRLGWKSKFGFPTEMAKDAIGIKSYRTYSETLNDLVEWGFIKMVEKSTNQYSANIIALVKNVKATTKALAKATLKHGRKQSQSTGESIDSIDKPNNLLTLEPINHIKPEIVFTESDIDKAAEILNSHTWIENISMKQKIPIDEVNIHLENFLDRESLKPEFTDKPINDIKSHFINWIAQNGKNGITKNRGSQTNGNKSSLRSLVAELRKTDQPDSGYYGT